MDLIALLVGAAGGLFVGAAGYRYMLKRNPEKLEAWAREIKARTRG